MWSGSYNQPTGQQKGWNGATGFWVHHLQHIPESLFKPQPTPLKVALMQVIREEFHDELDWQQELADAEEDARARCAANRGRAPWGCRWFEDWRRSLCFDKKNLKVKGKGLESV